MARGRIHPYIERVRDAVTRGDSLTARSRATGGLFPSLFLEMTQVGEQTGTLGRVYRRLESHYRRQSASPTLVPRRHRLADVRARLLDRRHRFVDLDLGVNRPTQQRQTDATI